jgi:hypothetical protein
MPNLNPTAKKKRPRSAPRRTTAASAAAEIGRRELLGFPAALLRDLPLEVRFGVQARGLSGVIHIASRPYAVGDMAQRATEPLWFDGDELRALAIAAQAERVWGTDLKGFCLRKLHEPDFRVTEPIALAGAQPDAAPLWSLGEVLRWLELELISIEIVDEELTQLPKSSAQPVSSTQPAQPVIPVDTARAAPNAAAA